MGYRAYLGKIGKGVPPVKTVNEEGELPHLTRSDDVVRLHELGKYVTWRPEGAPNLLKMQGEEEPDCGMYVVDEEFLLFLIEEYRKKIAEHHTNEYMTLEEARRQIAVGEELSEDSKAVLGRLSNELERKSEEGLEWGSTETGYGINALCLDKEKPYQVTMSWLYEYTIFNLVAILKTMDWENEELLFYFY